MLFNACPRPNACLFPQFAFRKKSNSANKTTWKILVHPYQSVQLAGNSIQVFISFLLWIGIIRATLVASKASKVPNGYSARQILFQQSNRTWSWGPVWHGNILFSMLCINYIFFPINGTGLSQLHTSPVNVSSPGTTSTAIDVIEAASARAATKDVRYTGTSWCSVQWFLQCYWQLLHSKHPNTSRYWPRFAFASPFCVVSLQSFQWVSCFFCSALHLRGVRHLTFDTTLQFPIKQWQTHHRCFGDRLHHTMERWLTCIIQFVIATKRPFQLDLLSL